jgi:hypothetical protein
MTDGVCVECTKSLECADPTKPICNLSTNTCAPCTTDQDCIDKTGSSDPGVCMSHQDGHCATAAETIYVKDDMSVCVTIFSPGDPGSGTILKPLCSMEPVPMLLSSTRSLVLVRGTATGGTWTFTGQGVALSIVGQDSGLVAGGASPGFSIQSGSVYIRDLEISSSGSSGIAATGGTVAIRHVTVDGCKHGGILLDGASFDIEDSTVSNNMAGIFNAITSWGGILINNPPNGGLATLQLLSVQNNGQTGITCSTSIAATGVLASGNGGGDIIPTCGFSSCGAMSSTCGAQ